MISGVLSWRLLLCCMTMGTPVLAHQRCVRFLKTKPCVVCKTTTASKCAGCGDVNYCSSTCQKKDWRSHKLTCSRASTAPTTKALGRRRDRSHMADVLMGAPDECDQGLVNFAAGRSGSQSGVGGSALDLCTVKVPANLFPGESMATIMEKIMVDVDPETRRRYESAAAALSSVMKIGHEQGLL